MSTPDDVGQPFRAAGGGRFPAPRRKDEHSRREIGKSPEPADSNVCPTPQPSPLLTGFHSRDQLPHLKREGGPYFVTFRLAGTLPASELLKVKHEREQILVQTLAAKRPLTWHEQEELLRWYSDRVERYLDAGHGDCWLRQPAIADLVASALHFHERVRFDLLAWVVMPNHVHAVVRPRPGWTLSKMLQSWKGYTAHKANRLLSRTGYEFWQRESFDHLIRNDDHLHRCCHYTTANPVNAGLCTRPEDCKWNSLYRPHA